MSKATMKQKMMQLTLSNLRKILRGYNKEFKIVGISSRGKEELINEFVDKTDKIKTDFNQVIKDLDDIIKIQRKPVTDQTPRKRKAKAPTTKKDGKKTTGRKSTKEVGTQTRVPYRIKRK
jgi:hypothetical protein